MNNYHTHTCRCKHAEGDIGDYIKMAKLKNMKELGFSDHTPLPDSWRLSERMGLEELEGYVEAVLLGRRENSPMRILLGLECDYSPDYIWYFEEILEKYPMDYLIGSIHAFPWNGELAGCFERAPYENKMLLAYAESYVKAMECGLFTFMAHPDLYCLRAREWNPETIAAAVYILEAAEALNVPLEINCSGIRKSMERGMPDIAYPKREFWELAGRYDIRAIVSSDAHSPKALTENMDAGYFILKEYEIQEFVL